MQKKTHQTTSRSRKHPNYLQKNQPKRGSIDNNSKNKRLYYIQKTERMRLYLRSESKRVFNGWVWLGPSQDIPRFFFFLPSLFLPPNCSRRRWFNEALPYLYHSDDIDTEWAEMADLKMENELGFSFYRLKKPGWRPSGIRLFFPLFDWAGIWLMWWEIWCNSIELLFAPKGVQCAMSGRVRLVTCQTCFVPCLPRSIY